ncbi:MAG TPA: hypothetical protein VN688_10515 [Gemmataceae bacterium]|nr:hypothetical protein [Gemmataceae bacterium]
MVDLGYDLSSLCGPIDMRVAEFVQSYRKHRLEPAYLEHARRYHGGVPGQQYFDAADGKTYRVGRFLTLVDEESVLKPPARPSWSNPGRDIRVDWSMLTLIDEEGPSARHLFYGEELLPFAALYSGPWHPDEMSLSDDNVNLLAFYYEGELSRVVVWLANEAATEFRRWEAELRHDEEACVRFADFTVPVASDFEGFLRLLRAEP